MNGKLIRKDYRPQGTCLKNIILDVKEDNEGELIFEEIRLFGGCSGGNQGLRNLLVGKRLKEIIPKLENIICKNGTSCQKELAKACSEIILEHEGKNPIVISSKRKTPISENREHFRNC